MILLTLLAITGVAHMSQLEQCTLPRLYACLESLQSLGNSLDKVTSKEQLVEVCRQLKSGMKCVDGHLSSCFTSGQRKVFYDMVFAARLFLEELCIEGPMQTGECGGMYDDVVQISQIADKEASAESGLSKTCCAFKDFLFCKYKHVSLNCGEEAADFLHHHLDRISSPLLHQLCVRFSTQEECFSKSSATSGNIHRYLPLFYALIFVIF